MSVVKSRKVRDPFDTSSMVAEGAERQALAALVELLDRDAAKARTIGSRLRAEMFKADYTGDIFAAMAAAWATVETPTGADVLTALRQTANEAGVDAEGDPARLLFVDLVADPVNTGPQAARLAEDAAREVVELHARRHAITAAAGMVDGLRTGGDPAAMVEGWAGTVERVREAGTAGRQVPGLVTFDHCVDEYLNAADDAVIRTGFRLFDHATDGGLPVGELTGLAAPPGAGKSALALQLVIGAMIESPDLRALWCLGEMTPKLIVRRASCVGTAILGADGVDMRAAKRRTETAREAAETMRKLLGGGRFSVLKPPLTVDRIAASIEASRAKVVVIDYLQLMVGTGVDRIGEMEATLAELTTLAVNTETAVVVVSSMSKAAIAGGARLGTIGKGTAQVDYQMSFLFEAEPDEAARESGAAVFDIVWRCRKGRNDDRISFTARFDGPRQFYSQPVDLVEDFASFGMSGGVS